MSSPKPDRHAPEEVDAYLAELLEDMLASLERVRTIIHETAPERTERVSYKIPIFRLRKDRVGISAQKNHCAFHTMSPSLVETIAEGLNKVKVSGATLHFTLEYPLSREIIVKIIRNGMKEVAER